MALTRKFLSTLGIEADKIDEIINAHSDTVNALKGERDQYRTDAEKLPAVQTELDALKADVKEKYVAKADHDKTVNEFQQFKTGVEQERAKAAKEKAVRSYYEGKGFSGKNLDIAMRGSSAEIAAIELDANGKIKDASALDSLATDVFGSLTQSGPRVSTSGPLSGGTPAPQSSNQMMNAIIRGSR